MAGFKAPMVKTTGTKDPEELKEKQDTRRYICCGCCGKYDSEEDDQGQAHENGPDFEGMSSEVKSDPYPDKVGEYPKADTSEKSKIVKGSSKEKTEEEKSSPPKDSSEPQDMLKHLKNDVEGEVTKKISPDQGDATAKDKKVGVDGKTANDCFPDEVVRKNTLTNAGRLDSDSLKSSGKDNQSDDGAKEDGKKPESTDDELSSDASDIREKVDIEGNEKKDTIWIKDKKKVKDAESKKSEEEEKGGSRILKLLKSKSSKSEEKSDETKTMDVDRTLDDGSEVKIGKDTLQLDKKDKTKAEDIDLSGEKDSEKDKKSKRKTFKDFLSFKWTNNS